MFSNFRLTSPADRRKSIRYFHSNSTFLAFLVVLCYAFDFIAPGTIEDSFAISSTNGRNSLLQIGTYWLLHRDLSHLCTNVSLLLLLGPRIERVMSEFKFYVISGLSMMAGGFSADQMGCGISGTTGLVLAYALIVLRYCRIEGVARQTKRSLNRFPAELDVNLIFVVVLCAANLFNPPEQDRDSEWAHMITAVTALLLINYKFGPRKQKKRTSLRLTSPKEEENAGFVQSFRNAIRRNNSSDESDSDAPDPRSKRLLKRIPGFRSRKGKKKQEKKTGRTNNDDYSSSEEESDSDEDQPRRKGLYANIPKSKLKGRQARADSDDSDRSD